MAKIESRRLWLAAPKTARAEALRLLQAFQKVQIENVSVEDTVFESTGREAALREDAALLEKASAVLRPRVKEGFLDKWKDRRVSMSFEELERAADNGWRELCEEVLGAWEEKGRLESRLAETAEQSRTARDWTDAAVSPVAVRNLRYAAGRFFEGPAMSAGGVAAAAAEAAEGLGTCLPVSERGDRVRVLVLCPRFAEERTAAAVHGAGFVEILWPHDEEPDVVLRRAEAETAEIRDRIRVLDEKLDQCAAGLQILQTAEEALRNRLMREEAAASLPLGESCFFLAGWILPEDTEKLRRLFEKKADFPHYLAFAEAAEDENPPVSLKNNRIFAAFENLTEMYGMPGRGEVDPTPFMAPFYLVFFGMMVADAGYGLVVLLGTLLIKKLLKPGPDLASKINFFYYLSYPTVVWGLIYGSFFGVELPFVLLSPSTDIIPILIVAVILGWVQIMTALALNAYAHFRNKDPLEAVGGGLSWMGLLLGLALLVLGAVVTDSRPLFLAGAVLGAVSALAVVAVPVLQSRRSRGKGLLKGLYALYGATGYIGDLVSYSRLMALGVAGGSIAVAFNTIIRTMPFIARITLGLAVAVALQALNLFLSMLGAYVHGIRLQYVEMFGKFYGGTGRRLVPFKTSEKHVSLRETDFNASEE